MRRIHILIFVIALTIAVIAVVPAWWRTSSLLPFSDETRTFVRADVVARYCPFSTQELSHALGLPVASRSVTLGPPPARPKLIHCVFTAGQAARGNLTLSYFLREHPSAILRHNRQFVQAEGVGVVGNDIAQSYVFNGNATAEYISGDFTAHWTCLSTCDPNLEQMRGRLAGLPRRPPSIASAGDVWTMGAPISGAQTARQ